MQHAETTAANTHDVTILPKQRSGEKENVHGSSGYPGAEKREDAITPNSKGKKIRYIAVYLKIKPKMTDG